MSNELTIYPKPGSDQARFEFLMMHHFGMQSGVFAIETLHCVNVSNYVNEHIQWMWEQYKRKLTRK